ncbi:MAG: hypothetical protein QW067_08215 [Thermofilaceae archaeon]
MSNIHEDFAKYLSHLMKSKYPIELVCSLREFAPFWNNFLSFVEGVVQQRLGAGIVRAVDDLYGTPPEVSLVPRFQGFVVYVKNQGNIDDVYLGVNAAHVSLSSGFLPLTVPMLHQKVVKKLIKASFNPVVLEQTLVALPLVAAIPCTDVVKRVALVKDLLTVKYSSYLLNRDLAYNLLGYILSLAVGGSCAEYRESFTSLLDVVGSTLRRYDAGFWVEAVGERYFEVYVEVYAVEIG